MRLLNALLGCFVLSFLGACTHVKGIALEDISDRPMKTAKFSVGRPDGVGSFGTYGVNGKGEFDFYISSLDEASLYVYDGAAAPQLTMRHLDQNEINDKMKVRVHAAAPNAPSDIPSDLQMPR